MSVDTDALSRTVLLALAPRLGLGNDSKSDVSYLLELYDEIVKAVTYRYYPGEYFHRVIEDQPDT